MPGDFLKLIHDNPRVPLGDANLGHLRGPMQIPGRVAVPHGRVLRADLSRSPHPTELSPSRLCLGQVFSGPDQWLLQLS